MADKPRLQILELLLSQLKKFHSLGLTLLNARSSYLFKMLLYINSGLERKSQATCYRRPVSATTVLLAKSKVIFLSSLVMCFSCYNSSFFFFMTSLFSRVSQLLPSVLK